MTDIESGEDLLGVVLVWNSRPQVGRYGFLTPFRRAGFAGRVLFFDETSLAAVDEPLAEGALVHFNVAIEQDRPVAGDVRVERFFFHDNRLDFEEDDVLDLQDYILSPAGPVFEFIQGKFSTAELERLNRKPESKGGRRLRDGIEDLIADKFNALIGGSLIYEKKLFAHTTLRNQTKHLLKKNPENSELRFLNRLLLEDAIESEISDPNLLRDCSALVVDAEIFDFKEADAVGRVKHEFGMAHFYSHMFPPGWRIPPVGTKVKCRILRISQDNLSFAYDIWEQTPRKLAVKLGSKSRKIPLTLPLQFDDTNKVLIDVHGNKSRRLHPRLADVISAWFGRDPVTKRIKLELDYATIGRWYEGGKVRKKTRTPDATDADIATRLELRNPESKKLKLFRESPEKFATGFASDFTRWLKGYHIRGEDLFENNESARTYYIVRSGWHQTSPMINRAERRKVTQLNRSDSNRDAEGPADTE